MSLRHRERLIFYGAVLFLFGLIAGLAGPLYKNSRLGLSAHLEGVLNGMFLILVGAIWDQIRLNQRQLRVFYYLLIWGGFINWFACIAGAALGASRMTPIAGGSFQASPMAENFVAALFGSVGLTMTAAAVLLVWGLLPKH